MWNSASNNVAVGGEKYSRPTGSETNVTPDQNHKTLKSLDADV